MSKKKQPEVLPSHKSLRVWTAGEPGDTCPKRGGVPLCLGDGQCTGGKRKCKYFLGVGYFVTIRCSHPEASYSKATPGV